MNQKSELANKLKDVLNKMSQEEFDKEWSKVTSLNIKSPSLEDYMKRQNFKKQKNSTKGSNFFKKISLICSSMCRIWIEKNFHPMKWYEFYFHIYHIDKGEGISFRWKKYRITYHYTYDAYLHNKWADLRNRVGLRRRERGLPFHIK